MQKQNKIAWRTFTVVAPITMVYVFKKPEIVYLGKVGNLFIFIHKYFKIIKYYFLFFCLYKIHY